MGVSIWQIILIALAVGCYLIIPIFTGRIAAKKGRSFLGWFVLGIIFPIAILFVLIAPSVKQN